MKKVILSLLIAASSGALTGCSKLIVLRDPVTGHTVKCRQEKSDVMAGIGLAQGAEECARFHESLGFRRID